MSEDLHKFSGEPEKPGQRLAEAGASQESLRDSPSEFATSQAAQSAQPVSESIIPEQPLYPPPPEFYAQMPAQSPYGVPTPGFPAPGQGMPVFAPPPGYGFPQPPYGYRFDLIPQAQPLPLGQAIRELPGQYKKILFKPGMRSFAEEQGKAEWGIIWIQLLFQLFIGALLSVPQLFFASHTNNSIPGLPFSTTDLYLAELVGTLTLGPAIFFGQVGIQYLLARAFKGAGSFKQQAYNQLLFAVPLGLVSSIISAVFTSLTSGMNPLSLPTSSITTTGTTVPTPGGGYLIGLLLFELLAGGIGIYTIVLNVFSIMAAHRVSGGKATAVVLIPIAILYVVVFVLVFVLVLISVTALMPTTQP